MMAMATVIKHARKL